MLNFAQLYQNISYDAVNNIVEGDGLFITRASIWYIRNGVCSFRTGNVQPEYFVQGNVCLDVLSLSSPPNSHPLFLFSLQIF